MLTALPYKAIQVVDIPKILIPSPLASNLAPLTIKDLKEYLVGRAEFNGKQFDGGKERGKEFWLSWKRAWDLWNNYYIEGRLNPVWIREELERREQAEKEAKGGKKNMRKRKRTNSSGGDMTGRCTKGVRIITRRCENAVAVTMRRQIVTGRWLYVVAVGVVMGRQWRY